MCSLFPVAAVLCIATTAVPLTTAAPLEIVASRGHVLSAVCFIPDWFWGVAPVLNSKHFDVQGLGQPPSLMLGLLIIIVLL